MRCYKKINSVTESYTEQNGWKFSHNQNDAKKKQKVFYYENRILTKLHYIRYNKTTFRWLPIHSGNRSIWNLITRVSEFTIG